MSRDDLRAAVGPWLVARVLVAAGWVVAAVAADDLLGHRTLQLRQDLLAWDGAFYRDIAAAGYDAVGAEGVRFFPFFPLLGRALSVVFLGREGPALVLLANACAFGVSALAHRVVRDETGDAAAARRAAWLVALFPAGFVLVWGYAEAMFLLAAVGAMLAMRRGAWWWAAGLGAAAALCRPVGVLLALAAAVEVLGVGRGRSSRRRRPGAAAAVLGPVAGAAVYLAWVEWRVGGWWDPISLQSDLRGGFVDPFSRLVRAVSDLAGDERLGDGLHLPFAVALVALLVVAARLLPLSYTVYAGAVLVVALSAENLNSLERYGLNAFPLVLALAIACSDPRAERAAMVVSAGGLVGLSALAWLGAYVP